MTKLLFLLILFSKSVVAIELEDLSNCFQTIEINNIPVQEGPDLYRSQTMGEFTQSPVFFDENKIPYETLQFVLFTGFDSRRPGWYKYHSFILPLKNFHLRTSKNTLDYEFSGNVLFKKNYSLKEIDFYTRMKVEFDGEVYKGELWHISKKRQMNYYKNFVLAKLDSCRNEHNSR